MSTDVLHLPRIGKTMASEVAPSNHSKGRSDLSFPSITASKNVRRTQFGLEQRSKESKASAVRVAEPVKQNRHQYGNRKAAVTKRGEMAQNEGTHNQANLDGHISSKVIGRSKERKSSHFDRGNKAEMSKRSMVSTERGFENTDEIIGKSKAALKDSASEFARSEMSSPYREKALSTPKRKDITSHGFNREKTLYRSSDYSRSRGDSHAIASETRSSKRGDMISLQQLLRYRGTVLVYLDSGWKNSRKERFYSTLEEAQVKQWKRNRLMALRHQQNIEESKARQLDQLRYIRRKHEMLRNRRLNTQHVKWKYVFNGKEGDRKEYGLPSEYLTYYGFHPEENPADDPRKVRKPVTKASSSTTASHSIMKEKNELRKRNLERYEHLFATKRSTQLEMVKKIIQDGLYTLEIDNENHGKGDSRTREARNWSPDQRSSTKRTQANVVVKNIIDDAKKAISSEGDGVSSVLEYDCETDDESTRRKGNLR